MLHIERGHDVAYLTDAVATGRENYYSDAVAAGEPPGRWYGAGAELLGLSGEVDHDDLRNLYHHFLDPRDPGFKDQNHGLNGPVLGHRPRQYRTPEERYEAALAAEPHAGPERRTELRMEADRAAQRNVAFFDVTYSVQKSVTVLHTAFERMEVEARCAGDSEAAEAWGTYRTAVEDAIWAGWRAGIDYLQDRAGYARVGHHGGEGGRWVDSHRFTVAGFFQHDSRDHDPQLHIHGATLNRIPVGNDVGGEDWLTLDGRALYRWKQAAGAVMERTAEEHLTTAIPWVQFRMRPDGKSREIVGISSAVMDLFSSRRRAITPKVAQLVDQWRDRFGREPNSLERVRLARQATLATRQPKAHDGETREQQLERWNDELRAEVAGGLAEVASTVLDTRGEQRVAEQFDEQAVVETALADVQSGRAAWTRSELTRAVNSALPDQLGGLTGQQVTELVDGLAEQALAQAQPLGSEMPGDATLPAGLRLASGASSFARPGDERYATRQHLQSEAVLRAATVTPTSARLTREQANMFITQLREQGIELGVDQAEAVRGILTSGAGVEGLVGPAGTGKSFTVGMLAHGWQDRALWGGQHRVFGLATSQAATNVLAGDGVTARNVRRWTDTQARLAAGTPRGDDHEWQLSPGDLVVVDESAMTSTGDLTAIHRVAAEHGAKLLLVGDHRQLPAVGAAGGMDLVVNAGRSYELAEARRFVLPWERAASLRLRDGDPAGLLEYRKHGRIKDSGTVEQAEAEAVRAWLADTLRDKRSLLIADTNEQAARMSAAARAEMVSRGRVEEAGVPVMAGQTAGVGDVIQARRNGWELSGWEGNRQPPINRQLYRVTGVRGDGGLEVQPLDGGATMRLPGRYVSEHVTLGYASTVHSAQGLTVDTSHVVATGRAGPESFYVAMSRGRQANTAHVVTISIPDDAPPGMVKDTPHRDPMNVLIAAAEQHEEELSATAEHERLAEQAATLKTAQERFSAAADQYTRMRASRWLDQLAADGIITARDRRQAASDPAMTGLTNVLRRAEVAGRDPQQVLRDAAGQRTLFDAVSVPTVLHSRITRGTDLSPKGDRFADWVPQPENSNADRGWQTHLRKLAEIADERAAATAAADTSTTLAASRELEGWDEEHSLPPAPKPGQVEQYAMWRAAWRAEGRPEDTRREAEMSDGQLRMRVRGYRREEQWAPDYVAHELSGTHQAAAKHRADATLHTVEGRAEDARRSDALATLNAERAVELERADEARMAWWTHTSGSREAADRARLELSTRGVDPEHVDRPTTARQWLQEHRADQVEQDRRRMLDETELISKPGRSRYDTGLRQADQHEHEQHDTRAEAVPRIETERGQEQQPEAQRNEQHQRHGTDHISEPAPADIREQTRHESRREPRAEGDWTRVPSAGETADSVARASRALREIAHRHQSDHLAEQTDRDRQLAQWHSEDAERELADGDVAERIPSLAQGQS